MLFFQNLNPYTSVAISDFVLLIYNDNNTEQLYIKLYGFLVFVVEWELCPLKHYASGFSCVPMFVFKGFY